MNKIVFIKISSKITLVQGRSYPYKKRSSIAFLNFFLPLELDNKLSNQLVGPLKANLSITVIFIAVSPVLKYMEENLQQILKTVLEVQALSLLRNFEINP